MLDWNQVNSLDCCWTFSMPYEALCADQDTRTAGTICPDIYLATLEAAEILFILSAALHVQVWLYKYIVTSGAVTSCLELQNW